MPKLSQILSTDTKSFRGITIDGLFVGILYPTKLAGCTGVGIKAAMSFVGDLSLEQRTTGLVHGRVFFAVVVQD